MLSQVLLFLDFTHNFSPFIAGLFVADAAFRRVDLSGVNVDDGCPRFDASSMRLFTALVEFGVSTTATANTSTKND